MSPNHAQGEEDDAVAEVNSLTFITLRSFLPERFGAGDYGQLRERLPAATLEVLDETVRGGWVAETHMQTLLGSVYADLLHGDDEAFLEFARELASAGISRFLRIFLSLASERFVLRKIPVVWKRLRRNAGQVTAEVTPGLVRLHYVGFPFFSDRIYRLLSFANCQALVFSATRNYPAGRVVSYSSDSLVLAFELRT